MGTETTAMERSGAKRAGDRREVSSRAVWIVLLALLVLLLGACSDSDATPGDETTTSRATTATPGGPDATTSVPPERELPECSEEALWAAAPQSDLEGDITDFACTPGVEAITSGWAAAYAWALVEAPEVDAAYILYAASIGNLPEDEGGGPYFGDWEVLTWGSSDVEVFCSEEIPAEACDMLGW
jgi:hypothetical protein